MKRAAALVGMVALASCAPVGESEPGFASADDTAPVRTIGEPVSCLSTTSLRQSKVRDSRTIDFETRSGKVYRNDLGSACPGLQRRDAITYSTSIGRLCRGEIVYVLEQYGSELERGAGCGLGDFQQIEYLDSISDAPEIMDE